MQTITEIETQEKARRDAARAYESLTGQRVTLKGTIARLETSAPSITALETIAAQINDVPADLMTRGRRFYAGGFELRDMLRNLIGDALNDVQRKIDERNQQLADARTKLSAVDAALTEFE